MPMQTYLFAHLIDKQPVGSSLEIIPLHITVLHWFVSGRSTAEIIAAARSALDGIPKIVTHATEEDLFGPGYDVPVMLLARTPELAGLHVSLVQAMKNAGAVFDKRRASTANWKPHVTHKRGRQLHSGEEVVISDIDLISRTSPHGNRMILHRFKLA